MISRTILQYLVDSREYWRKVLPYLKSEYFDDPAENLIFTAIAEYIEKYGSPPPLDALTIEVDSRAGASQTLADASQKMLSGFSSPDHVELPWLIDQTEAFCQDMAIQNALRKSITILEGKDKYLGKGAIPELLREALGISFDSSVGHDYVEDWHKRFDAYHMSESRILFDIEFLNKITQGGVRKKTLTCFMGTSGIGKSIILCHLAAANLMAGLNVLYITCELSEESVAERIDMNLLDCSSKELSELPRDSYEKKINRLKSKTKGRLVIKEYPPSTHGAAHFRHLLAELKTKQAFVPDVIYIDYINILVSTKVKMGMNVNSYTVIKAVAEEIRALAVENDVPIFSATQANRSGYGGSDLDMSNTSESMGLVHTVDLFLALISNEDLAAQKKIIVKQLKNRYRDENMDRKFIIGIDKSRMRLFNLEDSAQDDLCDDTSNLKSKGNLKQTFKTNTKFDLSKYDGVS